MATYSFRTGIAALIVSLFFLQGCGGGTKVTGVWKKSDFTGGPFKNILVIGLTKDERNKSIWEDVMAEQLRGMGVKTATSSTCFPGDNDITKDEILDYVKNKGIDGVLLTRLVNIVEEKAYYPPSGGPYYGPYYGGPRYRYYNDFGSYYNTVYTPGRTATFTTVLLETNLYDTATQSLVWSMSSDTFDPASANNLAQSVSKKVVDAMQKDNLIGPPK